MSKTLVVTHVMPLELEMFERFISYYKNCFKYLDDEDDVTMFVTLNLNPKLTDWDISKLKQQYFIDKFTEVMVGIPSHLQIIVDDSLWGTTQQKREVIELDYDQFIFVDPDISVHEKQLKLQLMAASKVSGPFVISPNIPRWWDSSWDPLVHPDSRSKDLNEYKNPKVWDATFTQNPSTMDLRLVKLFKFGCGMHTLYSKDFWNLIGIPKEFEGYGSEDTFAMYAALISRKYGYDVRQYILDGLYITEDKREENRIPSFLDDIIIINNKRDGKEYSNKIMGEVLQKFENSLVNKNN